MERHKTTAVISAVALSIGAAALPSAAWAEDSRTIETLIPELSEPQDKQDLPPEEVNLENLGDVDPTTVRSLGSDGTAAYWIGVANDQVCLVAYMQSIEISAASCATYSEFDRRGIGLGGGLDVHTDANSFEAYLLPRGVAEQHAIAGELRNRSTDQTDIQSPSLITFPEGSSRGLRAFEVERSDGSTFDFTPMAKP